VQRRDRLINTSGPEKLIAEQQLKVGVFGVLADGLGECGDLGLEQVFVLVESTRIVYGLLLLGIFGICSIIGPVFESGSEHGGCGAVIGGREERLSICKGQDHVLGIENHCNPQLEDCLLVVALSKELDSLFEAHVGAGFDIWVVVGICGCFPAELLSNIAEVVSRGVKVVVIVIAGSGCRSRVGDIVDVLHNRAFNSIGTVPSERMTAVPVVSAIAVVLGPVTAYAAEDVLSVIAGIIVGKAEVRRAICI